MSSPQRTATGSTAVPPRRRRPVWAWLLLALLAIAIVIAILLLTGRCGSGSTGAPPAPPAAGAGAPAAGSPAAGAGTPPPAGAGSVAPGAPGTPGAPGSPAGGSPTGAGSAPGAPVDAAALQGRVDQIVAASPITFRANSAELTDSGAESLERVADELTAAPTARVQITGYAAPLGGPGTPAPQQLSDERATAVADALTADGVTRDRLQTRGASDTEPRPDPAASRRAEITVS